MLVSCCSLNLTAQGRKISHQVGSILIKVSPATSIKVDCMGVSTMPRFENISKSIIIIASAKPKINTMLKSEYKKEVLSDFGVIDRGIVDFILIKTVMLHRVRGYFY